MFAPAVAGAFALLAAACASTQKTDSTTATVPGTSAGGPAATANIPRHPPGQNPFIGAKWWDDPYSQAHLRTLRAKNKGDAEAAQLMGKIAQYGGADWIGEWTPYVERWVDKRITLLSKSGALPYFVAYKIPKRDCGQYSAGGAAKGQEYKEWIDQFARAIGTRKAVVIVEPDALASLKKCLSEPDQQERTALVRYAVHAFAQLPQTWVYIDAGHSSWIAAPEMAARLKAAGVEEADGFALNVSNYKPTDELMAYGKALSSLVGGKHFVIDTSRNGNGGPKVADNDSEAAWCNPAGRALGSPPTAETGEPLCDAFLWIKKPGESDGACNGGPKAGEFWPERAIELAKNAKW
ncbi:MAG: glycoside hydrolase family 6 protein [Myxococcales bacterium]